MAGLLVALLLAADGGAAQCRADADWVVTESAGCCAPCPAEPHPELKSELAHRERRCASVDCTAPDKDCPPTRDRLSDFDAVCSSGVCAMVPKPSKPPKPSRPSMSSCSVDSDCTLTEQAGCCPACPASPPRSLTKLEQSRLSQRCAKQGACQHRDEVCPPPVAPVSSYRAACIAGSCTSERNKH